MWTWHILASRSSNDRREMITGIRRGTLLVTVVKDIQYGLTLDRGVDEAFLYIVVEPQSKQ